MLITNDEPYDTVKIGDTTQERTRNVRKWMEPKPVNNDPRSPYEEGRKAVSNKGKVIHLERMLNFELGQCVVLC